MAPITTIETPLGHAKICMGLSPNTLMNVKVASFICKDMPKGLGSTHYKRVMDVDEYTPIPIYDEGDRDLYIVRVRNTCMDYGKKGIGKSGHTFFLVIWCRSTQVCRIVARVSETSRAGYSRVENSDFSQTCASVYKLCKEEKDVRQLSLSLTD